LLVYEIVDDDVLLSKLEAKYRREAASLVQARRLLEKAGRRNQRKCKAKRTKEKVAAYNKRKVLKYIRLVQELEVQVEESQMEMLGVQAC
jgi:hypothetical protein